MRKKTNENNVNCTDINDQVDVNLENAFSDLIAQFFENDESATTQTTNNFNEINVVNDTTENNTTANSISNGILYSNLETIQYNNDEVTAGNNLYSTIAFNENVNNLVNENNDTVVISDTVTNNINSINTDFKLTQANLPAKIGFWTKLRNFFIPGSKLQYSVQENNTTDTGVWNRVQKFFSFGKDK